MTSRQLIALGTSSQAPTRHRAHNSYALRWDDQLILFDPGEGAQRQCTLGGVAVAKLTAVCVTHFHGDHCLGLPGIIQRRALDNRNADAGPPVPLPIFYPSEGQEYFDRMRKISVFHDTSNVEPRPIESDGEQAELGKLTLTTGALDHRISTYGYRLEEPDSFAFDGARLEAAGIRGPDVGRLHRQGWLETATGRVGIEQFGATRKGQSMAFIMDTAPCEAAERLAHGVDLLVCESTFMATEAELAVQYKHMTAADAGRLAAKVGVRKLVLAHFSARYPDHEVFASEASEFHPNVEAAYDLATFDVPPREPMD